MELALRLVSLDFILKMSVSKYFYCHPFDTAKVVSGVRKVFSHDPRYSHFADKGLRELLTQIGQDSQIHDVRWVAYLVASVLVETCSPQKLKKVQHGKSIEHRVWEYTMRPVAEFGHGAKRDYFLPVKVHRLPNFNALVTEYDGDQFEVSYVSGKILKRTKKANLGAAYQIKASSDYLNAQGAEHSYYGRGYVQLTWWCNYAKASAALGRSLEFLFHPDELLKSKIAYEVMSFGMRTGEIFANGHKFSDYFQGEKTDYLNARRMINGHNRAHEIADIAKKLEKVLMNSKIGAVCVM